MSNKTTRILFALLLIFTLCSCSASPKSTEELYPKVDNWETLTLGSKIPSFGSDNCYLERDNDVLLSVVVENVSPEEYNTYVNQCIAYDFTYVMDSSDSYFRSYNSDNFELIIWYSSDTQKMEIALYSPKECKTLNIPSKVIEYLPTLPSQTGYEDINWDNTYEFVVNNVTREDFDSFVDSCNAQFGYSLHSNNDVYFYSTDNDKGIDVSLEFCGVDLMDVSFRSVDCNISDLPSLKSTIIDSDSSVISDSAPAAESAAENSVSYSTNDIDTAKSGNSGVFAYKSRGGTYDNYYIIDFDAGFIYFFSYGNGNSTCDRLKIDGGDFNSSVIFTYHDSDSSSWSESLHFKYKNQPDHLILEDQNGFEYDYYTTNLNDALKIRDSMKIIDY